MNSFCVPFADLIVIQGIRGTKSAHQHTPVTGIQSSWQSQFSVDRDLLFRSSLTQSLKTWEQLLVNDFDQAFLLNGIVSGFRLVPINAVIPNADCPNYSSTLTREAKPFLDKLFSQELREGKLSLQHSKPHRIHAIGAVPKKGTNEFRPITDCSRPRADSLNSYMNLETFSLESPDDALALSTPGCYYAIVDLKSAYRSVPVFPPHRQLQGMRWSFEKDKSVYLVDNFLCFGLSCAPLIFFRLSSAIARMLRRRGYKVVVYLDDFLVVGQSFAACEEAQKFLLAQLGRLGFEVNWAKVISPGTRVQFLGYVIDSRLERVELPHDKVVRLSETVRALSSRNKSTKRELQVFLGHACFASRAVYGARTFSRLLIDEMAKLDLPSHRTRVTTLLRKEFLWWVPLHPASTGCAPVVLETNDEF